MKSYKIINTLLLVSIFLSAQTLTIKPSLAQPSKHSAMPSRQDVFALSKAICGANNINPQSEGYSCNQCPSFAGAGSGTLNSVIYGSFTASGVREALVDLEGCEPHAGNWGGTVLLRRNNKGWSKIRYESALRSDRCLKVKNNNGRHSLICEGSYTQAGYVHVWLDGIEFNATKTKKSKLVNVSSNMASCRPPYYAVEIADFTLQDTNRDGRSDLVVKVSEARERRSARKQNSEQCEGNLPKPKFYTLTFLSNGQSFRPTSETAKLVKRFDTN